MTIHHWIINVLAARHKVNIRYEFQLHRGNFIACCFTIFPATRTAFWTLTSAGPAAVVTLCYTTMAAMMIVTLRLKREPVGNIIRSTQSPIAIEYKFYRG
jgi:hypothetical protein